MYRCPEHGLVPESAVLNAGREAYFKVHVDRVSENAEIGCGQPVEEVEVVPAAELNAEQENNRIVRDQRDRVCAELERALARAEEAEADRDEWIARWTHSRSDNLAGDPLSKERDVGER